MRNLYIFSIISAVFPLLILFHGLYKPPVWYTTFFREFISKYDIDFTEFESYRGYRNSIVVYLLLVTSAVLLKAFTPLFDYKITPIIYTLAFLISGLYFGIGFLGLIDGKHPLKKYNDILLTTAYKLYDRTYFLCLHNDPVLEDDLDHFSLLLDKCYDYMSYCKLKSAYFIVYYISFLIIIFVS